MHIQMDRTVSEFRPYP